WTAQHSRCAAITSCPSWSSICTNPATSRRSCAASGVARWCMRCRRGATRSGHNRRAPRGEEGVRAMAGDVFADAEHRRPAAVEALRRDLATVRTGRASPALIERLPVEYYGNPTPLQTIATIHAPDARTLTISPFDPKAVGDIEKAIQRSDLGLNPSVDG